MASDKPGFFAEMQRRHVWRVAVAYGLASWLVVQVATQVFPFFNIPNWAVRLVVLLLVIGFPVALACAWIFELTPEGVRRTVPASAADARPEHASREVGRRLNTAIIAVLVLALALMAWRLLLLREAAAPAKPATTNAASAPANAASAEPMAASTTVVPAKSVAVLPFANESGKPDEQFFSDGLSDDLINALSQFDGLKVISRNSAFQFRNSKDSAAEIGRKLGVAHLLEGNVQREAGEVRITATLVNAADGSVVWSQRYDKPYTDLFALQDAITSAVADALKAKLLPVPGKVEQTDRPPGGDVAAYTAYQQGKMYYARNNEDGDRRAITAFDEAIRIAPRYATAYAALSTAWRGLAGQYLGGAEAAAAFAKARDAAAKALVLDPDSSAAHQAQAYYLLDAKGDWVGAEAEAKRALELAPGDPNAKFMLGNLLATLGQVGQAADLTRQALQSDPRHAAWYNWLATYQTGLGHLDDARRSINMAISLQPKAAGFYEQLAVIEILAGDAKAARAAADQETDTTWRETALALALQVGGARTAAAAALQKLIAEQAAVATFQIAEVYALRGDGDNTFKWLERAAAIHDPGIGYLLYDPFILRYKDDPRFAAFAKKVGLPTTTDAVAMK